MMLFRLFVKHKKKRHTERREKGASAVKCELERTTEQNFSQNSSCMKNFIVVQIFGLKRDVSRREEISKSLHWPFQLAPFRISVLEDMSPTEKCLSFRKVIQISNIWPLPSRARLIMKRTEKKEGIFNMGKSYFSVCFEFVKNKKKTQAIFMTERMEAEKENQ